ncbi:MAG: extracellular solute-binding protein [Geminicoccaceae bacterium]|nr:extracellular solute-binding protein [Geminicoccaceae bacterium]
MTGLSRRSTLKRGLAASTMIAAPMIIRPYSAYAAREHRLVYWHQPMFTPIADQEAEALFNEYLKVAGVKPEEGSFITVSNADFIPKINASLESGSPPDAARFYESYVQLYRSQGHMMDVSDLVSEMEGYDGGLFESSLRAVGYDGKSWGVPFAINPWPMHARVDLLEQAGLEYPKTWDEFVETCKKIQSPPFYGFGMDLGLTADATDNIMQLCWCFGGYTTDEDGKVAFDNPGNVAGFEFINKMYNVDKIIPKGVVGNAETAWNNKVYQSGQVAFVNNPTSVYAYLADKDPDLMANTGLFGVPAGPAGAINQIDTWSTGIFNSTAEPELTKGWVAYYMQPDNYARMILNTNGRFVPVYPKQFDDPWWTSRPQFNEFRKIAETGVPVSFKSAPTAGSGEVLATHIIPEAVQQVIVNEVPAADAVAEAHAKIKAIYDRLEG